MKSRKKKSRDRSAPRRTDRGPGRTEPEIQQDPREAREQPEIDLERGPTSDVGGPRGVERGVGVETGDEVGVDVERGGFPPGDRRR